MAGEVIRELFNVVGLEVDSASAAKAEAAMKGWADNAERLGNVVAAAAGKLADFINQTGDVARGITRIGRALERTVPGMAQLTVQSLGATRAMAEQLQAGGALREGMSAMGKETWLTAKKTSALGTGFTDMALGVEALKRAEASEAKAAQTRETTQRAAAREEEKGIGTMARLGLAIQGVREVMGLAAGAAHFLVGGLVETSRETLNAAKVAGVSAGFFQEMAYAAKTLGIQADDVRDVMLDLSDKAASGGKDQEAAFSRLGVKVKDTNGKLRPMEELIGDLADGFAKMQDGTEKTATASTLLGEQGARLLPIFSKGRAGLKAYGEEARRAGIILDDDALQSAQDFSAGMVQLEASGTSLRNTIGGALLPALGKLARSLDALLRRIVPVVKVKAKDWADGLAKAAEWATTGVDKLRLAVTLLAGAMLGKLLLAISTVTAAELTWGSAALIAGARAAAGAVLAVAPWLLVGIAIAIATDELYGFATGSDSALGSFIKWLDKVDPEDNKLVNMLKRAGSLVFDLTDMKKWESLSYAIRDYYWGVYKAILMFFVELPLNIFTLVKKGLLAVAGLTKDIFTPKDYGPAALPGTTQEQRRAAARAQAQDKYGEKRWWQGLFAGSYQTAEQRTVENTRLYGRRDWVQQRGIGLPAGAGAAPAPALMSVPQGPDAMTAYFGRGASAATALPAMSRATAPSVFAPNTTIQMTVQAAPGMSAEDVGAGAVDAAYDKAAAEKRQALAMYQED